MIELSISSPLPLCIFIGPLFPFSFTVLFFATLSIFLYFDLLLLSVTPSSFLLFDLPDIKFRVGRGQRWNQEDAERCAARRECKSRPRQIQNAAADPTGQHEAAHRWVWVHVRTAPLSLRGCRPELCPPGCSIFMDNRCCRPCNHTKSPSTPPGNLEKSSCQKLPKSCPTSPLLWISPSYGAAYTSLCASKHRHAAEIICVMIYFLFWANMAIESYLCCCFCFACFASMSSV